MKITWLGHSTVLIETDNLKRIIIDPWIHENPSCPASFKHPRALGKIDLMLITHAHFDHIGDAIPLAKESGAQVVAIYEICHWLGTKGITATSAMNKGGSHTIDGITITMVHADHSCGIMDNGQIIYGGEAVGYILTLENGVVLYHAGDTAVFGDMKLIADLYKPTLAMLPIGDNFTMSPREAAYACDLLNPQRVLPLHHGTFPALTGTPAALRRELEVFRRPPMIIEIAPGQSFEHGEQPSD